MTIEASYNDTSPCMNGIRVVGYILTMISIITSVVTVSYLVGKFVLVVIFPSSEADSVFLCLTIGFVWSLAFTIFCIAPASTIIYGCTSSPVEDKEIVSHLPNNPLEKYIDERVTLDDV